MNVVELVVLLPVGVVGVVVLLVFAIRCARTEFGRLVANALAGYADERAARRPSARVNDIDDVTFDLNDVATPEELAAAGIEVPVNQLDERVILRDLVLHGGFTAAEHKVMRELSKDLVRPRRNR